MSASNSSADHVNGTDAGSGPEPHEDFTIAELLKLRWLSDSENLEMTEYRDSKGRTHRISKANVARFLEQYGALHPGEYAAQEGCDWREDFYDMARD